MDNHYHLLLETREANLSRGMRQLNGIHAQQFNVKHERTGHVFEGRYVALVVDRDSYHLELSRYIVLNPVRAGLCRQPQEWPWSSYRAVMGLAPAPERLEIGRLLSTFARNDDLGRTSYEQFVRAGIGLKDPTLDRHGVTLGDEGFVARTTEGLAHIRSTEIIRRDRSRVSLAQYARTHRTRNEAIRAAYDSGAYSLVAIGQHFGLHYSSVSRIVGRRQCFNSRPDPNE
jgi:hypothetical protein